MPNHFPAANFFLTLACASGLYFCTGATPACAQSMPTEPGGLAVAAAMEKVVIEAIARSEASVVAIGLFRHGGFADGDGFARPEGPRLDSIPDAFGTGVVLDRRGLILTNYHVLREHARAYVRFGGQPFWCTVRVKAADPLSDLAVLEITDPPLAKLKLEPIALGDGGRLRRGQFVISLGNPYAIGRDGQASAAWGIVSNLGRRAPPTGEDRTPDTRPTMHHFGTLIQTDAKLNLGTSGGPLLNLKGEMVGLTTSMAALAGYEKSAGFAIAVDDTFRRVVKTLLEGKEVEYGFLGVAPADMAHIELTEGERGVRINNVVEGTPAFEVLRPQDIVTHVAGEPVSSSTELMLLIGRRAAGERIGLSVLRQGRPLEVTAMLTKNNVPGRKIVTNPRPAWRGMRVEYPSALRSLMEAEPIPTGCVIVTEVEPESPAAAAEIRPGMRISYVEGQPVDTPDKFLAAVGPLAGGVRLRVGEAGGQTAEKMVAPPK